MPKKSMPTPHAVACAAQKTLMDEALLPPTSADGIGALEDDFGIYPTPTMSALTALEMAKGECPLPQVHQGTVFPELGGKIQEELGLAARKGSEIPLEMWEKMKSDRKKAEDERARTEK